jgi:hypothetical protein
MMYIKTNYCLLNFQGSDPQVSVDTMPLVALGQMDLHVIGTNLGPVLTSQSRTLMLQDMHHQCGYSI